MGDLDVASASFRGAELRRARNPVVLVVGTKTTLRAVSSLLRGQRYLVTLCRLGVDAIKCAARLKPEFVITDADLEDITGRELSDGIAKASPLTQVIVVGGGRRGRPGARRRRRPPGESGA